MIVVTRLHGSSVTLNCDLIQRVEATPDTVVTLVDGTRYVIRETPGEVVEKVRAYRASVVALAHHLEHEVVAGPALRLVPDPDPDG